MTAPKFQCSVENPSAITVEGVEYEVISIGSEAFYGCSGLTSVTVPNSVTSIGSSAFAGCKNIENVYNLSIKVPKTDKTAFEDSYIEYATLHVSKSRIYRFV